MVNTVVDDEPTNDGNTTTATPTTTPAVVVTTTNHQNNNNNNHSQLSYTGNITTAESHHQNHHPNDYTNTRTSTESNKTNDTHSTHSKTSSSSLSTTATTTTATQHLLSHSLHNNMLQKHQRDDPMQFYTIEAVLGEGSMVRMNVLFFFGSAVVVRNTAFFSPIGCICRFGLSQKKIYNFFSLSRYDIQKNDSSLFEV
jgi:hypothetical protein